jgi:uncharacterized protein (DUF305 family)/Spy/CpxP family protein refolding chaperone
MQWLGKLTLIGLVVLTVGGCAGVMSGGHRNGMDHSAMSTPMAGMDHSGMMTHTETMTGTQMGHMAHSMMQVDPSQPFDAQFIDSMLEHHRGAVTMAEQALAEAEHEELRTLAEGIIAAQTQEIEQMTAWRTSWYPDLPPTAGMDMSMGQMTISEDDSKPFDQRFIEAMISHHQGAIDMAKMAQQMAEHEEIKTLADAIIIAQQAEIEQMQSWLKEWYGVSAAASPYVAQLDSPVRGLSAQEVDDLRAGRGMGFARMAELNNYPGPRHVLDLQEELKLSAEQQASIEAIFSAMQTEAQALGEQILTQEEQLSAAFVSGVVDEATLQQQVMTLAELYGQLRMTHLRAHLQVTPLLTPEQITTYNQLRGYTGNGGHEHMHNMQH